MGGRAIPDLIDVAAAAAAGAAALIDIAAGATEIALEDGRAPTRFKLLPMGAITMRDGRGPFRIRDQAHGQRIVAATAAYYGAADMAGDYCHQTLAADPANHRGGVAPASAWVKPARLTVEADGIWANDVAWTPAGAAAIEGKEYRYISPLFRAHKPEQGGDVTMIRNFALVPTGAIESLPALIAAGATGEDDTMDLSAIATALGLKADATVEDIAAAVSELQKPRTVTIAAAAGLGETASEDEIVAAIAALKARAENSVPASVAEGLKARLDKLDGDRIENRVDALVAAGVVSPGEKAEVLDWFRHDEARAEKFLGGRAPLIAAGTALDRKPQGDDPDRLTADEIAACAALGIDQADFLKTRNADQGIGA